MNYKSLLYEISNANQISAHNQDSINVPSNKQLYEVDLNTREIHGPEFLSVQTEHYAETVYFLVDRYYDHMDLARTNCVIQYIADNKSFVYAVPFCDTTTFYGGTIDTTPKIIIPWCISSSATQTAGTVKYFIRFYLIDENSITHTNNGSDDSNAVFSYSLSTLPASAKVLKNLPQDDFIIEDQVLELPERYIEIVDTFSQMVDNSTIYWIEADALPISYQEESTSEENP